MPWMLCLDTLDDTHFDRLPSVPGRACGAGRFHDQTPLSTS
jgi:hypothetical protein